MSIDKYIEGLVKEASDNASEQEVFDNMSMDELLEIAGLSKTAVYDPLMGDPRWKHVKDPGMRLHLAAQKAMGGGGSMPKWLLPAVFGTSAALGGGLGGYLGLKKLKEKSEKEQATQKENTSADKTASLGGVALGAGAGGLAGGAMMRKKTAAVKILEKLAKYDIEDVREAIQEAKGRESVPEMRQQWGAGGGVAGGLGGAGIGAGIGALLRRRGMGPLAGIAPAVGLGAAGAFGGARLGAGAGEEEAKANKLVSYLRMRKAHAAGAQKGLQAGTQRGFLLSRLMARRQQQQPFPQGR